MNITILMDRSFRACTTDVARTLYAFVIQLLQHLKPKNKNGDVLKYRFGGYGSTVCFLSPTTKFGPFPYVLEGRHTAHQELTEQSRQDLKDVLQGQPFPTLGTNNIREALLQVGASGGAATNHTIVVAYWEPGPSTADTWNVMQSLGSVTLVNLHPDTARVIEKHSLWGVWPRSPRTARLLSKHLKILTRTLKKPTEKKKEAVKLFTMGEVLHIFILVSLHKQMDSLPLDWATCR